MKETQSPALVCNRAAAGSDPVHTGLPPIRGRSEKTFHVLHLPQHRTLGPMPRSISAEVSNCPEVETALRSIPTIFPVARSTSSLSDAIPCLQSSCRTRGLTGESGRDAATKFTYFNSVRSVLTVPVPKLRLELDLEDEFTPVCPSAPQMCSRCCTMLMTSSRRLRAGSYTLASLQ